MSQISATRAAAQKAVEGLVSVQGPYQAWNYGDFQSKSSHVNDTSITIWASMALKSAKVAGLQVPGTAFEGVMNWVDHAQDLGGAKAGDYEYQGGRMHYRGRIDRPVTTKTTALLTAAAGVIRVFWGQKLNHPGIVGPANILLAESLPGKGPNDYYTWYYATLLMFQKGGDHWRKWNAAMPPTLLGLQVQGDPREMGGSWDPQGSHYVPRGGRVFSTSLGVLSLEVYYRYLPMYSGN